MPPRTKVSSPNPDPTHNCPDNPLGGRSGPYKAGLERKNVVLSSVSDITADGGNKEDGPPNNCLDRKSVLGSLELSSLLDIGRTKERSIKNPTTMKKATVQRSLKGLILSAYSRTTNDIVSASSCVCLEGIHSRGRERYVCIRSR